MSAVVVSSLYKETDRVLTDVTSDLDAPISKYFGHSIYAIVSLSGQTPISIDVNKTLSLFKGLTSSMTYRATLTAYLTAKTIPNVQITYLPRQSAASRRYENRLEVYDVTSRTGWSVDFGDVTNPNITSDLSQVGTLGDIILTPPTSITKENILVSVCGVFHKTKVVDNRIYVISGFSTIKQTGKQDIVVCDTTKIGGHTILPITEDLLSFPTTSNRYDIVTLNLNNTTLEGKSVFLSVDGYLQLFSDTYQVRSKNTIKLFLNRLSLVDNYLYAPFLKFSRDILSIKNRTNPYNPSQSTPVVQVNTQGDDNDPDVYRFVDISSVPKSDLDNKDFYVNRLTSPHSFIIILNNPYLYLRRYNLIERGESSMFECFSDDTPRGFLFYSRGYVISYTNTVNPNFAQYLIYITSYDKKSRLYETGMNDPVYPSAALDWRKDDQYPAAHMVDVYTGDLQ